MPEDKKIAKRLFEECKQWRYNFTNYYFELQAVERSEVTCDIASQEYD
jgi:hypothetical protein